MNLEKRRPPIEHQSRNNRGTLETIRRVGSRRCAGKTPSAGWSRTPLSTDLKVGPASRLPQPSLSSKQWIRWNGLSRAARTEIPPQPHAGLTVVPLAPGQRYYGETPAGLAGASGAGWEESGAGGSVVENLTCARQTVPNACMARQIGTNGTCAKGRARDGLNR